MAVAAEDAFPRCCLDPYTILYYIYKCVQLLARSLDWFSVAQKPMRTVQRTLYTIHI